MGLLSQSIENAPSLQKIKKHLTKYRSQDHVLSPARERQPSELLGAVNLFQLTLLGSVNGNGENGLRQLSQIQKVLEQLDSDIVTSIRADPDRHRAKNAITRLSHSLSYRAFLLQTSMYACASG